MSKSEIIDLLLENQPTILMVVNRVEQRLISQTVNLFDDDVRTQWLELVRSELINELSYCSDLTIEDFSVKIDEEEFAVFLEELLKDE